MCFSPPSSSLIPFFLSSLLFRHLRHISSPLLLFFLLRGQCDRCQPLQNITCLSRLSTLSLCSLVSLLRAYKTAASLSQRPSETHLRFKKLSKQKMSERHAACLCVCGCVKRSHEFEPGHILNGQHVISSHADSRRSVSALEALHKLLLCEEAPSACFNICMLDENLPEHRTVKQLPRLRAS